MHPLPFALLFLLIIPWSGYSETKIKGVSLPPKITLDGTELQLNGAGVRSKFFIDLYVGALYLQKNSSDANGIINNNETMLIRLDIISGMITSERMIEAIEEGFNNATTGDTAPIRDTIDGFIQVFSQPIVDGDSFDIGYMPLKGLQVKKNNQLLKTMPVSLAFKQALFGIWLSDKPAQKSLKKQMLGR